MKKSKKYHAIVAGLTLMGPIINGNRDIIKGQCFPFYQEYAAKAAKCYESFGQLYNPYITTYIEEKTDVRQLISDIESIQQHYKAILAELGTLKEVVDRSTQVKESIVMVTPYPGKIFDSDLPQFIDLDS